MSVMYRSIRSVLLLLLHAALSLSSKIRLTSCDGLELGSHGNARMLLEASHLVAISHPFEDVHDDNRRSALLGALGLLLTWAAHSNGLRRAAR